MVNSPSIFRVVRRPTEINSPYALLVIDGEGLPHHPLTIFYHKLHQALSDGAARTYLNSVLAFFSFLATDEWRRHRRDQWNSPPPAVQEAIRDYLVYRLGCKVHPRETYATISLTAQSPSTIRVVLAAIKHFYQVMIREQCYAYANPLIDVTSRLLREIEREEGREPHRMPQISGVEDPISSCASENFFRLAKDPWQVLPVDDPDLAKKLVKAFKAVKLSLRDQVVVRMAFESGARIREILQVTIGDWRARGGSQEARACSKGSRGRRVKVIRFSDTTAKMLRQYLNTDRVALDPQLRRLEHLSDHDPLFLSQRRKPYDYEAFKPHWKKLCTAAKTNLRIHDLRHGYVTQAMRVIAESATTSAEVVLRKEELVRYMAWRSPETIHTYENYFKGVQHYTIQDKVHQSLEEGVAHYVKKPKKQNKESPLGKRQKPTVSQERASHERRTSHAPQDAPITTGWGKLLALGGAQ